MLYISQAEALVNGTTATLVEKSNYSCEHSYYRMNPDAYPPGYPVLLSPLVALFGVNLYALKWLNAVCYMLTMFLVFLFVRKRLSAIEAVLISILRAAFEVR